MCLIQINNFCVFFKFRLLIWSLFNLQMCTHMYKFKPFPMYYIWNNSQLLCLVINNVGTCTYIEDRRLPSESMYVPVYMCVFTHIYKFKPFPMYYIWNNSQLLCLVNNNVGTCSYIEDLYGPYLICKCTHTCINSSHSPCIISGTTLSCCVW